MKSRAEINRDQLSVLLAGATLSFILSRVLQLPTQQVGFRVLGSPLGVELSTRWLMTAFVVGLVITGTHSLLLTHPLCRQGQVRRTLVFWILPGLTALVTGALLARPGSLWVWLPTMIAGIVALGVVTANEFRLVDAAELKRPGLQLLTALSVYGLALALLTLIYATRARTLLVGPAAFAACGLLAMRLLWNATQKLRRVALYGGVVALVLSQAMWALNYLLLRPLPGGLLLLLVFYVTTGLAQQSLLGRMSRRVLVEHGVVALAAAVVVLSLR